MLILYNEMFRVLKSQLGCITLYEYEDNTLSSFYLTWFGTGVTKNRKIMEIRLCLNPIRCELRLLGSFGTEIILPIFNCGHASVLYGA